MALRSVRTASRPGGAQPDLGSRDRSDRAVLERLLAGLFPPARRTWGRRSVSNRNARTDLLDADWRTRFRAGDYPWLVATRGRPDAADCSRHRHGVRLANVVRRAWLRQRGVDAGLAHGVPQYSGGTFPRDRCRTTGAGGCSKGHRSAGEEHALAGPGVPNVACHAGGLLLWLVALGVPDVAAFVPE